MPRTRKRSPTLQHDPPSAQPDVAAGDDSYVPETGRRQPSRPGRGQGGRVDQMAKVGDLVSHKPRGKKTSASIPDPELPANPMAPERPKPRKKTKVSYPSFNTYYYFLSYYFARRIIPIPPLALVLILYLMNIHYIILVFLAPSLLLPLFTLMILVLVFIHPFSNLQFLP